MKVINRVFKFKKDADEFDIPKNVQGIIPINRIWKDGIFLVGKNKYTKTFLFTDVNYAVASRSDKEAIFLKYSELLNSLDSDATTKITIINRKLNRVDFEKNILLKSSDDNLDKYRNEYNQMLLEQITNNKKMIQEKYITVSIAKKSVEEARNYFKRIDVEFNNHLRELGSHLIELDANERLRLIHDFYRLDDTETFNFDNKELMKKGHNFKDYICPSSASFQSDYFEFENKFGRAIFLKEYANFIKDDMISELTDIDKSVILSIDIIPIPMDVAIREVENRRLGVETNITNWQRRQNSNNNFSAVIPYDMEQQRQESKEMLDDLTTRDQRMFVCVITYVHTADTKKQLDEDTESILSIGQQHLCQLGVLKYQQLDGLNTALPYGMRRINALRTLTTESLAVFTPFRVQEVNHTNGIYYGLNVISKNMIVADRKQLLNGNSFILGVSGSGKSFSAKNEIVSLALRDSNADILIIDPEIEYAKLIGPLNGQNVVISATSNNHINPMDINSEYGEGSNPVTLKSEFILSLCEILMKDKKLGPLEESIIDRCTNKVYRSYQQGNYQGVPPTLIDLREELLKQPEKEAKDLATVLERYTNGSFNTFAMETNVNINSRIINYDILELDKSLRSFGMLVVLDNILNRITLNRNKGRNTYIFIDEIYLLFQHEYSANFLFKLWKRVRKYGAYCTGITQNVEDLLQSHTAKTMLANSELIVMLNQAATDRLELAKLLNISEMQLSYITNSEPGEGLLKIGSNLIPFENHFPKDLELYKLMSTNPKDK